MLLKWLLWCDVVHVYGRSSNLSFWIISKLSKYKFVTFVGSDIRVPEIELAENPNFKFAFSDPGYEYKCEQNNRTSELLQYLRSLNFNFIVWDVDIFIDEKFKPYTVIVPNASTVNAEPAMGGVQKKLPLIVHSPTAPIAKGTPFVMDAIEKLKLRNIQFEFVLLKDLPNDQYQQALAKADIYLDQFIWGAYGVAAQQALQMGKVVVNYLTAHRIEQYGPKCPIQNANVDNMVVVLEELILDVERRQTISEASKLYYQNTHEPGVVGKRMLAAYDKLACQKQ